MTQGQPSSSDQSRPWFYQNWFLFVAFILGWPIGPPFVLWPVGAILVIRSPWHTKFPVRALAWAMLLSGAGMLVQRLQQPGGFQVAVVIALPGVVLTVLTQALWARYKMDLAALSNPPAPPDVSDDRALATPRRPRPRPRPRRRAQRRRGSRPGRTPRQP